MAGEKVATQMVLYENDAVVVSFTDRSGIQLAPCASSFTYHHARKAGDHPLHGHERIQQRCEFVTSTFKESVKKAIDFRNKFADRPYLYRELLYAENVLNFHTDVCDIAWPEKLIHADYCAQSDGSITLVSRDQCASVTLDPSRQSFKVQFLCHTSQHKQAQNGPMISQRKTPSEQDSAFDANRVDRLMKYCVKSNSNETKDTFMGENMWDYAMLTQHFSVQECPDNWKHPLSLVLECAQSQRSVSFEMTNQNDSFMQEQPIAAAASHENEGTNVSVGISDIKNSKDDLSNQRKCENSHNCIYSTVPKALPLNCMAAHLHKWCSGDLWDSEEKLAESAIANGRIKVVFSRGVIYRFLWQHPRTIEIYPGDGTVLRSSGLSGHFFNHYYLCNGKIVEKMYSIDRPPPDIPGAKYSTARLVSTAALFLRHLFDDEVSGMVNCCWRVEPQSQRVHVPLPTELLEECTVPGVGRFTAHSSGRVRIVFSDRTALDMLADFSTRLGHCKKHSDDQVQQMPDIHTYQPRSSKSRHVMSELPIGVARLMLPNGHYQHVILSRPQQYMKYVRAAKEWVSWVNSSPTERQEFYKDTLHDASKVHEIDRELRKISCFNYIIEKTLLSDFETNPSDSEQYLLTRPPPQIGHLADVTRDPYLLLGTTFQDSCTINDRSDFQYTTCQSKYVSELANESDIKQFDDSSYFPALRANGAQSDLTYGHSSINNETTEPLRPSEMNFDLVQEILRKTSQTVSDLDSYLGTNSETQPVQDNS